MSTGFERISNDSQLQDHWIRRVIAFIIDSIIVGIGTFIIRVIIWLPFGLSGSPWYIFNPLSFPFFTGILSVLYFAFFEAYYEGTIGKRLMKLQTTKLNGQRPPLDSAFVRNATKLYWVLVLIDTIIGLAMSGDPRQKATDRVAGTIVVSTGSSPVKFDQTAQPKDKFCPQCGKQLTADVDYCPYCGKRQT